MDWPALVPELYVSDLEASLRFYFPLIFRSSILTGS